MDWISQRVNERGRLVVDGRRTDDGDQCSLLVVCEVGGRWCLRLRLHAADVVFGFMVNLIRQVSPDDQRAASLVDAVRAAVG